MLEPAVIEKYKGYTIEVHWDDSGESPRDWDNAGTMVCWHSRHQLGDKHDFKIPGDFLAWWKQNGHRGELLELYLYDHSGLRISTSPFSCRWDSGQIGWIYVTKETIWKEWGKRYPRKKVRKYLQGEVETYDQYLRGDVYGYRIFDTDDTELDSCWGFYGEDTALEEAKSIVDTYTPKEVQLTVENIGGTLYICDQGEYNDSRPN